MSWKQWAQTALDKMNDPHWTVREKDKHRNGGEEGARKALEYVAKYGYEPYYTLKGFVVLNNLEAEPHTPAST